MREVPFQHCMEGQSIGVLEVGLVACGARNCSSTVGVCFSTVDVNWMSATQLVKVQGLALTALKVSPALELLLMCLE